MNIQLPCLFLLFFTAGLLQARDDLRKPAPSLPHRLGMGAVQEFQLPNGLRVIVVENHKLPRVSVQVFVDLPPVRQGEFAGFVAMTGQMLARGTQTRTKAQIDEAIHDIGAALTTGASGIFAAGLSKHREKLLELVSDVLLNPSFPREELEKLKTQTRSGLATAKEDLHTISANVSNVLAYGKGHPYGELTTEKTIDQIDVGHCKAFYHTYFNPEISYLVMTGDISLKEAKTLAGRYFSLWRKGIVMSENFQTPEAPPGRRVAFVHKINAAESVIHITFPVQLAPGSPDAVKVEVMNTLLGGYPGSRLHANICTDKGYSHSVFSSLAPKREVTAFHSGAAVRTSVTDSTVVELLREMERLRTEPASVGELEMAKRTIAAHIARGLELPEGVAQYALDIARFGLPKDYYSSYLEKLDRVSVQDIMDMAGKYLLIDHAWIVVAGNKDIASTLDRFSADGKVKFYDFYGDPLEDAHPLMPEGMDAGTVVDDYLAAIGGREKLAAVKDMSIYMKAEAQGTTVEFTTRKKAPGKMLTTISAGGTIINQVKCDGENVEVSAMGQKQHLDEQTVAATLRQARIFPELFYAQDEVTLQFRGIEAVGGKNACRVDVIDPEGNIVSDYFDLSTYLRVRSVNATGEATTVTDYDDYRATGGIRVPYKITVSGALPFTLVMRVEKAAVNEGLDDNIFTIK